MTKTVNTVVQGGIPGEGVLLPAPPVPRREVPLHRQLARCPFQREEGEWGVLFLLVRGLANLRAHWPIC
jgi:hypothetical protein